MNEQAIQRKIISSLKLRGAYIVKVISASKAGVPDILACYRGVFIGIEVKTPKTLGNVSKLQKYNLNEITKAGGLSFVASDIETVNKQFDNL